MEERGLKAAGLARLAGVSHVTIGNYLGGRVPHATHAQSLARVLGVSVDDLLNGGPPADEALGVLLAAELRAAAMSAAELARELGADEVEVQRWLAGERPGAGDLRALAARFPALQRYCAAVDAEAANLREEAAAPLVNWRARAEAAESRLDDVTRQLAALLKLLKSPIASSS